MGALRTISFAIVLVNFASIPLGIAHDHATGVVKERMDGMEAMARHMKAIADRIKSRSDLETIKKEAEAIAAYASHVVHLFPKGSTQKPTEARVTIWQNWADFTAKARALEVESGKLAALGVDNFDALSAQVQAASRACSACHEKYRVKK